MSGPGRPLIRCGSGTATEAVPDARLRVTSHDDVLLVGLVGKLDATGTAPVRQRLLKLLADVPSAIVVDVSGLSVRRDILQRLLAEVAAQNQIWPRVPIVATGSPLPLSTAGSGVGALSLVDVAESPAAAVTQVPRQRNRPRRTVRPPAAPLAASRARAMVGGQCREQGVDHLAAPAQLVASELVTNALCHVGYGIRLTVESDERAMTVEVRDPDPSPPQLHEDADPLAGHGRGLGLVNAAVTAWGCLPTRPGGKVVWAAWALDSDYSDACSEQAETDARPAAEPS